MPLNVSDQQRSIEFEHEPQAKSEKIKNASATEEGVPRQESLLRSVLNSLTNPVFILEATPNSHTRIIVDCNTAALKVFGYDKNELIGKPINMLHVSNENLQSSNVSYTRQLRRIGFHLVSLSFI